jgi:hypothetical protein
MPAYAHDSGVKVGLTAQLDSTVAVTGTGDCLRLRTEPTLAAPPITCAPDGAEFIITDGPRQADGHSWYQLRDVFWGVSDYLEVVDSSAPISTRLIPLVAPPAFAALLDDPTLEQDSAPPSTLEPALNQAVASLGQSIFNHYAGDCRRYVPTSPNPWCSFIVPQRDGTVLAAFMLPRSDAPLVMFEFVRTRSGWSPTFGVTGCGSAPTAGPYDCITYPDPL